ncbi:MAG: YfcE family phosphodiesterase [Acidaminobacter sp.]|uniref:metallophosphoesterase n=1 Tax=Acidaminobacter sp. TaxID=1872102 RepID=UPI001382D2CB|nr:metallophosphoesterase [Acidaminobacter sp.]MZQ97167.1 YfcE family phosphodiesterase [Acidaminobacter sp.]
MKLIVISDTHGEKSWIQKAVEANRDASIIIHCGDFASDLEIVKSMPIEAVAVTGNVPDLHQARLMPDDRMEERILIYEGVRILLTHGHRYDVKYTLNKLFYRAQEAQAELVLFGHTHTALNLSHDGITFLNPGSPARPRGGKPGYGIIDVEKGNFTCRLVYF